jgi:hypothetical protein
MYDFLDLLTFLISFLFLIILVLYGLFELGYYN